MFAKGKVRRECAVVETAEPSGSARFSVESGEKSSAVFYGFVRWLRLRPSRLSRAQNGLLALLSLLRPFSVEQPRT